jgi:hypothetical protein
MPQRLRPWAQYQPMKSTASSKSFRSAPEFPVARM